MLCAAGFSSCTQILLQPDTVVRTCRHKMCDGEMLLLQMSNWVLYSDSGKNDLARSSVDIDDVTRNKVAWTPI